MIRINYCIGMALVTMVVFCAIPGKATTFQVSKSGSDTNPCTAAQPCLTIGRARNLATQPGDIVQVGSGTYNERINITANGTAVGGKITFRGHDGSGCPTTTVSDINHPTGSRPNPAVTMQGFNIAGDFVRVECFKVDPGTNDGIDISTANTHHVDIVDNFLDRPAGGGTGIYLGDNVPFSSAPANILVQRNYITRFGFGFLMHCNNCTFDSNEVFDLRAGSSGADGDYSRVMGDTITFVHNYFHGNNVNNCPGCHIDCWQNFNVDGSVIARNITLDGNVCFNAHEGVIMANNALTSGTFTNVVIKNNLIGYGPSDGHPWCILLTNLPNPVVFNNVCIGGGTILQDDTGSVNNGVLTVKDNIFFNCGSNPYDATGSNVLVQSNNLLFQSGTTYSSANFPNNVLNQNPLFVNSAGDDYHIQSGSPAKDTGANVGVLADLDGNVRPFGAGFDIGAYEFGSGAAQRPQPPTNLASVVR
jgi:hypothetical protein